MIKPRKTSVTRTIPAGAATIFAVIDDPAQHPRIDGSGSVVGARTASRHLVEGDRFAMDMRMRLPYRITSKVVEYEKDRLIAWAHVGGHRWRYELTPEAEGATTVTETFDWSTAKFPPFIEWMGFPGKHVPAMKQTLARLEEVVTGPQA